MYAFDQQFANACLFWPNNLDKNQNDMTVLLLWSSLSEYVSDFTGARQINRIWEENEFVRKSRWYELGFTLVCTKKVHVR